MRVIKFRGFYIRDKCWVYGGYYKNLKGVTFILEDNGISNMVHPETLGQFTGKSSQNLPMYEGDVVRDNVGRVFRVKYSESQMSFVFVYLKNKTYEQPFCKFIKCQKPFNVIGNIHDNPELLENNND